MDHRVQSIIAHMRRHLHRQLTNDELAKLVNLSPSRLRHLFKFEIGASLAHYLHHLRMEEAKRLVETTYLSPKQIISRVGLNDESHFSRGFKHDYGLPPMQYRNRFHESKNGANDSP